MKKVAVIMGSKSDLKVLEGTIETLRQFDIPFEVRVISAHRTPDAAAEFAKTAKEKDFGVLIAAAGKAAHLGGFLAAYTILPVIALPIKSSTLDGLDSLLSMVQMPKGVPVATVAIDGAQNAALLAAQILALSDASLSDKLAAYKRQMAEDVLKIDEEVRNTYKN